MAKPVTLPRWADVGGDIDVPASGTMDVGWVPGVSASAQYMNWFMNLVYQWLAWLDAPDDLTLTGLLTADSAFITGQSDLVDVNIGGITTIEASFRAKNVVSANIGTTTNDWAPTGHANAFMFRINATASFNLSSLAGGADGRMICIANVAATGSGFVITILADTGGTAANRFIIPASGALNPNESALFMYDGTSARWRRIAK